MADNKSFLESIARSFGYHFGKRNKVRVNTISQSPTITTAGSGVKGFDGSSNMQSKYHHLEMLLQMIVLNTAFHLFSDLTQSVTMQNLFHDGGFSNTGVSEEVLKISKQIK